MEIRATSLSVGDYVADDLTEWARVEEITPNPSGGLPIGIRWTLADGTEESSPYDDLDMFTLLDLDVIEPEEWDSTYVVPNSDGEPVEPGDPARYPDFRLVVKESPDYYYSYSGLRTRESVERYHPRYMEIPATGHSGLDAGHGDFLYLSNYERIREDFPDHVIAADGGGYGSAALFVRVGAVVPSELVRVIAGLRDYPVYDEEDHSRREMEALWEWAREVVGIVAHRLDLDEPESEECLTNIMSAYLEEECVYRAEDLSDDKFEEYVRTRLAA